MYSVNIRFVIVKHHDRLKESYPEVLEAVPEQHRGQIKATPEVRALSGTR